ncbi:MAG: divalent-cation tolerance protein CutA [Terriglobales bacterium]|jgi:periplasmic divalent cation tolerance protein
MTEQRLVLTTIGSKGEAEDMAWELVERKLAACVNIIEMQGSIYRWKGEVKSEKECLLLMKTTASTVGELFAAIKELHPYEVPECIALSIEAGTKTYLDWISESVALD